MHIVLISSPIGFLGSGKGGGVELTLNSLVSGLISLGHSVEVVAPKNSKLHERNVKAKLYGCFEYTFEIKLLITELSEPILIICAMGISTFRVIQIGSQS